MIKYQDKIYLALAKQEGYHNKKSKYKIYIMKTDSDSYEIDDKYIRFYLTDGDNNTIDGYDPENINSYTDLIALSSKPLGRLIYNGELESEEEKTFILRAWLSDEYMLKDEEEFFDFDIFVESKQWRIRMEKKKGNELSGIFWIILMLMKIRSKT